MCDLLLIDVNEAARRMGVGRSFLYQHYIQNGDLPSIKLGNSRRVRVKDLEDFVSRLCSAAEAEDG